MRIVAQGCPFYTAIVNAYDIGVELRSEGLLGIISSGGLPTNLGVNKIFILPGQFI
jgi:hypothetical protein